MEEDEADLVPAASQAKPKLNGVRIYKCDVCGEGFDHAWDLAQHLCMHTGDTPFSCDLCSCSFQDLATLHQHQQKKHGNGVNHGKEKLTSCQDERRFQCDQCDYIYKNSKDLRKHQRLKHQDVKEEGDEITVTLREEPQISNSTLTSTTHWTYKEVDLNNDCKYCGESFPNMTRLKIHVRIHEGKAVQKCKYCGIEFLTVGNLKNHMLRHMRELQIKCGHCAKKFTNITKLKLHKCEEKYTLLFMCGHCGIKCSSRNELTIHQLQYSHIGIKPSPKKLKDTGTDHDSSDQSPKAPLPVKQEKTPTSNPSEDSPVKNVDKKQKCDYCGKYFKSCHLKEHSYIHTGKPFRCDLCGLYFVRRSRLLQHQCRAKPHLKQKDFSVKKSIPLARQQKFCNKKPYRCKECFQPFVDYGKLLVHKLTVHGKLSGEEELHESDGDHDKSSDRPSRHSCTGCRENFMDPSSLSIHKCRNQSPDKTLTCQDCGTMVKVGNTTLSNVFTVTNLANVKCFLNNHTLV